MDENAYRAAYRAANPLPCAFGKPILTTQFGCEKSTRVLLAERVAVSCLDDTAHARCARLLEMLRHKALFALKITHVDGEIPHAKEMKVQCGGLLGLQKVVAPEQTGGEGVANIVALVEAAQNRFGDFDNLPFGDIVKSVTTFELRRRGRS